MANTRLEREPYYTSSIWTLHVDGKSYCFGEGPKFVQRVLGWDYGDFVRTCRAEAKRQHKALNDVFIGRFFLRVLGGRKALKRLDSMAPWDYYA